MKHLANEQLKKLTTARLRSLQKSIQPETYWHNSQWEGIDCAEDLKPEYRAEYRAYIKRRFDMDTYMDRIKSILATRPHIPRVKCQK